MAIVPTLPTRQDGHEQHAWEPRKHGEAVREEAYATLDFAGAGPQGGGYRRVLRATVSALVLKTVMVTLTNERYGISYKQTKH